MTANGWLQIGIYLTVLLALTKPMGVFMTRVFAGEKTFLDPALRPIEHLLYRMTGVDEKREMAWTEYTIAMLLFSGVSMILLYVMERVQQWLPFNPQHQSKLAPDLAFNTAASFTTNTNWQNYSGESTMSYFTQMAGLAYHNFASAAVGIVIAIAVVRGIARRESKTIGNFWVDMTRCFLWILLPVCLVVALVFVSQGMIQNLWPYDTAKLVNPQTVETKGADGKTTTQVVTDQVIAQGPLASQEAIKEFGTNGGGFFNANSAHPFENPSTGTNWFEIFLLLVISFSLPRTFGRMVGSKKQGYAIAAVMAVLAFISVGVILWTQLQHHGTAPTSVGSAFEGMEQRFGVANSSIFGDAATLTSTGAVDSMHDSYTSLGGMIAMFNMQLGEVAPCGTGSGLYGILVLAVITVFVAGLMVGRTPEYLGKKINPREIKLASIYFLTTPLIVLVGAAVAMALPGERAGMAYSGPHGLSEVLYAFTSAANNNG